MVRIASLVPSATEMLFALGLGDQVAAVTHECDHPPETVAKPRITRSVIPEGLGAAEIDAAVRELTAAGRALYELDTDTLARVEVDLIVTQALCAVCAVSYDDVRAIAGRLPTRPEVISLDPETLDEVLDNLLRLGEATRATGTATRLRAELATRIGGVGEAVAGLDRPRVVALEWLDPPFIGGHWVPEMIARAGGSDPLGRPGERSRTATWDEIAAALPDVVVAMPCGWYVEESRREALAHADAIDALGAGRVFAVDAASSFSRPGPRLAEGVELLAHLLHPAAVPAPAGVEFARIERRGAWA